MCLDGTLHPDFCFVLLSFAGSGVLICSIDNMPAQIPREATDFFGSLLLPHIPEMVSQPRPRSMSN